MWIKTALPGCISLSTTLIFDFSRIKNRTLATWIEFIKKKKPRKNTLINLHRCDNILCVRLLKMTSATMYQTAQTTRKKVKKFDTPSKINTEKHFLAQSPISVVQPWINNTNSYRCLYSQMVKTFYRQISRSLEAARLGVLIIVSLWKLPGISAVQLPMCLSTFTAIGKV